MDIRGGCFGASQFSKVQLSHNSALHENAFPLFQEFFSKYTREREGMGRNISNINWSAE